MHEHAHMNAMHAWSGRVCKNSTRMRILRYPELLTKQKQRGTKTCSYNDVSLPAPPCIHHAFALPVSFEGKLINSLVGHRLQTFSQLHVPKPCRAVCLERLCSTHKSMRMHARCEQLTNTCCSSRGKERGLDRWVEREVRQHRGKGSPDAASSGQAQQTSPRKATRRRNHGDATPRADGANAVAKPYDAHAARVREDVFVASHARPGIETIGGKIVEDAATPWAPPPRSDFAGQVPSPLASAGRDGSAPVHARGSGRRHSSSLSPVSHEPASRDTSWVGNAHYDAANSPPNNMQSHVLVPSARDVESSPRHKRIDALMRTSLQSCASLAAIETPVSLDCPLHLQTQLGM
jgi:hypothetical protein